MVVETDGRNRLQVLRSSRQFRVVYDRGSRFQTPFFTLFVLGNVEQHPRVGITVTRKIGGAVVRNRCKRRLREVARRHTLLLLGNVGCDIVINAKAAMLRADLDEIDKAFASAVARFRGSITVKSDLGPNE